LPFHGLFAGVFSHAGYGKTFSNLTNKDGDLPFESPSLAVTTRSLAYSDLNSVLFVCRLAWRIFYPYTV